MNETCEICGTPLTIQNSETTAHRPRAILRHVPGNCAQVLYAKLTAADVTIVELRAEVTETLEVLEEIATMTTDAAVGKMVREYLDECAQATGRTA